MSELYEFSDSTEFFRFSPSILSKTFAGHEYSAANIKRSEIQITGSSLKSQVTFTIPSSHSFGVKLLNEFYDSPLRVKIYKDTLVFWSGRIVSVKLSGASVQITCDNAENSETRTANGPRFSYQCWKGVYDANCTLNRAAWGSTYTASTVIGNPDIPIAGLTARKFDNGIAVMDSQERRIVKNTSSLVSLAYPFTGALTGAITLYPGCNLSKENCQAFGNYINFGGIPYIPVKNPMDRVGLL